MNRKVTRIASGTREDQPVSAISVAPVTENPVPCSEGLLGIILPYVVGVNRQVRDGGKHPTLVRSHCPGFALRGLEACGFYKLEREAGQSLLPGRYFQADRVAEGVEDEGGIKLELNSRTPEPER